MPGNSLPFEIVITLGLESGTVVILPDPSVTVSVELLPCSSVKNLLFSLLGSDILKTALLSRTISEQVSFSSYINSSRFKNV